MSALVNKIGRGVITTAHPSTMKKRKKIEFGEQRGGQAPQPNIICVYILFNYSSSS